MWVTCYVLAMPDASSGPAPPDEFDRELRELTEGNAGEAIFTEPSAAERATGAVPSIRPPGKARARHARRRRSPFAWTLFLVVIVAGATVLSWLGYRHFANGTGNAAAGPAAAVAAPAAPAVAVPAVAVPAVAVPPGAAASVAAASATGGGAGTVLSGTIVPMDPFGGTPADPFAGTPADRWADGAAGIVLPPAKPAGGFTRAQVAAAYETTGKLLIAANLDRPTLLGGAPTAFARLLTAAQRATFLAGLNKAGETRAGYPVSTRTWVASFAPGSTELIGTVIKVHGTMSARAFTSKGTAVLAVDISYFFAYAVEPPHDPVDWTRVIDHEQGSFDFTARGDAGGALQPWDRAVIDNGGLRCGAGDGYIHPAYPVDLSIDDREFALSMHSFTLVTRAAGRGAGCGQTAGSGFANSLYRVDYCGHSCIVMFCPCIFTGRCRTGGTGRGWRQARSPSRWRSASRLRGAPQARLDPTRRQRRGRAMLAIPAAATR
jgi:hypothetical protein